jgi:ribosomal protein L11 methyltransferase
MDYIELKCEIFPARYIEIVMAEFADYGFESFMESESGFDAYIPINKFSESTFSGLGIFDNKEIKINYSRTTIPDQNWNAVWESNFEPVSIGNDCYIRAPFHPEKHNIRYEIIIEPKMSFGTGHHETTHMMAELLLEQFVKAKTFLDMGCGTGILAILAKKMGADKVVAIDNDEWAFNNSKENIIRNHVPDIVVLLGDVRLLGEKEFDIVFANINRNILLNDIAHYAEVIPKDGILALSGFYLNDLETINQRTEQYKLKQLRYLTMNNWCASLYRKD